MPGTARSAKLLTVWLLTLLLAPALGAVQDEVQEITLENGLRIFVLERRASPTFAAMYQFGVGGASDPRGKSGIAHLLEHMMFKGTDTLGILDAEAEALLMKRLSELWHELHQELDREEDPFRDSSPERIAALREEIQRLSAEHKKLIVKNELDELMTRAGGVGLNASTGTDFTSYYIQLPANRLEFWFRLESDRLLNPVFREFYSERDVVHEERRLRTENSPGGLMREAMMTQLYAAHPYGTPVVGWPRDIERLVREDALDYFRTYYSPSNCVMVLVGDVATQDVERLAKKYLGPWERQEIPRLAITAEPEQKGERRRLVEFDAEPRIQLAWRTVRRGHPDQYALDILARVLGGLWSSRLDRVVVQKERIAAGVFAGHSARRFAGSMNVGGTVRGEHTVQELEAAVEAEIQKIQRDGITDEELERAKVGVEVGRVRLLKSNMGLASRIASSVSYTGSPHYDRLYEEKVRAVTRDEVQAVARSYLTTARKNVVELRKATTTAAAGRRRSGISHQRGGDNGKRGERHSPGFVELMTLVQSAPAVELNVPEIGREVERVELPGGSVVFIQEDHSAPSVEMRFSWLGGSNTLPLDELAAFELASQLLNEGGTEKLDPFALEERKEELGMSFRAGFGSTQSFASFFSLKRNFEESFELALDVLTRPRFDDERLATLKGQYIEAMKQRGESPSRGAVLMASHVLDGDHPRLGYVPPKAAIQAVTGEDIRRVWRRYLGGDNLYLTVVGDFEKGQMLELLKSRLTGWHTAQDKQRQYVTREPVLRAGVYLFERELPQPAIRLLHHIAVDREAPQEDHAALEILNAILGGSGFRSRLMERLRSDEGLTYGIRSGLRHEGRPGVPGSVLVTYQTRRDSVAHSIRSVLEEFHKIVTQPVGEAEVEEQIEAWKNRFIFRYTNDFFTTSRLMANELDDRPYDYDRRQLAAVQKVTVADVARVAKKYLRPENLTIVIYGAVPEEDRAELAQHGLSVLTAKEVFKGGYDGEKTVETTSSGGG